ncbi:SRPBCC domain-containing protein [uncultured Devosia sp.]|uniref:SRPBCC family protein n=1 Tax=uncultured Devosia sp. TaxID=211434 RepID=UPI00262AE22B|nr:SRPBCC domain-containing protein [uncultured Devosia sp.]
MSETDELVFETTLDAPPEKVWRALTVPEYLDRWLDKPEYAEVERITADEPNSVTFRLRERDAQGVQTDVSFVTFELTPRDDGGTWFRLTHRPAAVPAAANNNETQTAMLMRAA